MALFSDMMEEAGDLKDEIARLRTALEQIKARCAGDRAPYWTDDWQTTHSRGVILDLCDAGLRPSTREE